VADPKALEARLVRTVREALAEEGSIGLIAADAAIDRVAGQLGAAGVEFSRLDAEEDAQADPAAADGDADQARLVLVPATLAKGLEYDQVIVLEPSEIAEAEHDALLGLRRLYVVLTRAVTRLSVLHARPLPAELAG
jgi:sirohydrochlorin ferrochelatase